MCHVRVAEQTVLMDAIRDLINCDCSVAEKATVNDVVEYFTRQIGQTPDKTVTIGTAISDNVLGDKTVLNVVEKTAIRDMCCTDQDTSVKDTPNGTNGQEEMYIKKDETAPADDVWPVNDARKAERTWKLYIKVRGRTKNVQHRYCQLQFRLFH